MPISTLEKNVNILKKISALAKARQVKWSGSAVADVLIEGLTRDDVLV